MNTGFICGVDIPRFVEQQLNELEPELDLTFTRLAVLPHQIEDMDLPTRPTKQSDSRSRSFEGESVEVDAIPAPVLRRMVEEAILRHVDDDELAALERIEAAERETMRGFVSTMGGGLA